MSKAIRFGVQTWPQDTTWEEIRDTWKLVDQLGYDTAWTFDHFFPFLGDPSGPCLEGWMLLAALAAETSRVRLGVLVTGNTYRHPAVLAKMGATLDHTSGGRLILGMGAAWYELEHSAYGIPFYTAPERIARLDEAAEIIKRLWREKRVTFNGRFYKLNEAYCEPKPRQKPRPPLMIGGSGEKLVLPVVARHADQWNMFGSPALFRRKTEVLRRHCAAVGREITEIEISWAGALGLADSRGEKEAILRQLGEIHGERVEEIAAHSLVGSIREIRERITEFIEAGVSHFILTLPSPFDQFSIRRFAEELMPEFRS